MTIACVESFYVLKYNVDAVNEAMAQGDIPEDGVARLDRKERDSDGDGKVDVWERFNDQGEVVRTGRDTDGDGKMDVREE